MTREEQVILVDEKDRPQGTAEKMEAHRKGLLHRAFSVFLFNDEGKLLLQRRAKGKYHSGGLWTNTVCSHPMPGEDTRAAAIRRLKEEMGIEAEVHKIFDFIYRAELDNGLTEHEFDHVFIGKFNGKPELNPEEADDYRYMHLQEIREDIRRHPGQYTAWFKIIFEKSWDALLREAGKMFRHEALVFEPYFEEKIWGGDKLKTFFGKPVPSPHTGESWEVSAVPGKESRVRDGFFKGLDLRELWNVLGEDYFGKLEEKDFPLLVKYIDARADLSVQVHPGDELARRRHGGFGKNETWYILDAEPESRLYLGFKPGTTKEDYLAALKNGTVEELLNAVPVKPGDWYYVPAGTVHAIGKGIFLAEIQQSSDITYRIYDYNRWDKDGRMRPLHIEEALEAIRFDAKPEKVENDRLHTPYFSVEKIPGGKNIPYNAPHFAIVLNPYDNALKINDKFLKKGDTALLFAHETYMISGNMPWFLVEAGNGFM